MAPQMDSDEIAPREVRLHRVWLALGAAAYSVWWLVVQFGMPGAYNPLPSRLLVVGAFLAVLASSFVSQPVARNLDRWLLACISLLTIHYFYLVYRNDVGADWVIGSYVVALVASSVIETRAALIAYSLLVLGLALGASLARDGQHEILMVPGLVTILFLSSVFLRSRLALEHERGERMRLESEHRAATAAVALREEFIAIAAHELRSPLAGLKTTAEVASRELKRPDGPASQERLEKLIGAVERQVDRLSETVDALLDTSKLSSGNIVLERAECDCRDVFRECIEMADAEIKASGCSVVTELRGNLKGFWDCRRLEQVVSNLLRNALVYGKGAPVRLSAHGFDEHVCIFVEDRGIGIDKESQLRIFERFERASPSSSYRGMGLGLYIVRELVDAHAGKVRVESEPGYGARFIVELPRRLPAAHR